MKKSETDLMRNVGTAMMIAGAVAASPIDEVAATVLTGGAAAPLTPLQGAGTLVGGITTMALGGALIWASNRQKRGK